MTIMVTSVIATALLVSLAPKEKSVPQDLWQVLHRVDIETREMDHVADGKTDRVQAKISVRFSPQAGISSGSGQPGSFRAYRDLTVRPSKPASPFNMDRILDSAEVSDIECFRAFQACRNAGADQNIGLEVQTGLQRCMDRFRKNAENSSISINPMRNVQDGGWTHRVYGHFEMDANCLYEIVAEYEHGGLKHVRVLNSGTIKLGTVWIPQPDPQIDEFRPDGMPDKKLQETRGGITIQPMNNKGWAVQAFLPQYNQGTNSQTAQGYVRDVITENGEQIVKDMQDLGLSLPQMIDVIKQIAPEGTSMNGLNFPAPKDPCSSDFDAPPGVMWVPTDGAYQTMMTGPRFNLRNVSFDLWASVDGLSFQDGRMMRTLCMNMNKKEPAAGVKYFPYVSKDHVIPMLARRTDESNFRGPWDQARLWIYTDKATIEDINKMLANGVGTSAYLMALADVDWAGGLDDKMLKDAKFIKPEFMLGSGAPEYASNFLMNTLNSLHPKKAGEWLKGHASSMLQLVGPEADEDDNQHLADTLKQMLMFNAPEDRETALKFIQATQRDLAALKGKFGSGRVSLYSGRNEEVTVALTLAKAGFLVPTEDALAFVAQNGPGDANKALAKELMDAN